MDTIAQPGFAPISLPIPGGMSPNRCIVMEGEVPIDATSFSARVQCGQSIQEKEDIPLCVTFFFEDNSTTYSVNSYLLNEWGMPEGNQQKDGEEKNLGAPAKPSVEILLRPGDRCNLSIECHDTEFALHLNSSHIHDYTHRTDYAHISHLVVTGGVLLHQVGVVGGDGPMRWIVHEHSCESWEFPVVTLTDYNFATSILNSTQMWLVLFYSPPSGLRAQWSQAARDPSVRDIRFGVMDSLVNLDTVSLLGVKTCPTILHFPQGIKTPQTFEKYSGEYSASGIVQWALFRYKRQPGQPPGFGSPLPPGSRSVHLVKGIKDQTVTFDERDTGQFSIWHDWIRRDGLVVVDKAVGEDIEEDLVAIVNIDHQGEKTLQEIVTKRSVEKKESQINKSVRDNVIKAIAGPNVVEEMAKDFKEQELMEKDLTESNKGSFKSLESLEHEKSSDVIDTQQDKEMTIPIEQGFDNVTLDAARKFEAVSEERHMDITRQREDEMQRFLIQQEGKNGIIDSKVAKSKSHILNVTAAASSATVLKDKKGAKNSKTNITDGKLAASNSGQHDNNITQAGFFDKIIERLSKSSKVNLNSPKVTPDQQKVTPDQSKSKVTQKQLNLSSDKLKVIQEQQKETEKQSKGSSNQSKLSQKQSKTSLGKSKVSQLKVTEEQPKVIVEQPKVIVEQAKVIVEQPKVTEEQAKVIVELQKVIVEQPKVIVEQSKAIVEQPKVIVEQPKVIVEQPKVRQEKPTATQEQPKVNLDTQALPIVNPDQLNATKDETKVIKEEIRKHQTQEGSPKVSKKPSETSVKLSPKASLKMLPTKDLRDQRTMQPLMKVPEKLDQTIANIQQGVDQKAVTDPLIVQNSSKDAQESNKDTKHPITDLKEESTKIQGKMESPKVSKKPSNTSIKPSPKSSKKLLPIKDFKAQQFMQTLTSISKIPGEISKLMSNAIIGRAAVKESIKSLPQTEENYTDITQKLTNVKPITIVDGKDTTMETVQSVVDLQTSPTKDIINLAQKDEKVIDIIPSSTPTIVAAAKRVSMRDVHADELAKLNRPKLDRSPERGIMKSQGTSGIDLSKKDQNVQLDLKDASQDTTSTKSTNVDENSSLKQAKKDLSKPSVTVIGTPSQENKVDVKMEKVSTKSSLKRLPQREEKHPQITQKVSNVKFVEDSSSKSDSNVKLVKSSDESGLGVLFQREGSTTEPSQAQIDPSRLPTRLSKLLKSNSSERMSKASDPGEIYEEVEIQDAPSMHRSFFASMISMDWADRMQYAASDIRRLVGYSGCHYL